MSLTSSSFLKDININNICILLFLLNILSHSFYLSLCELVSTILSPSECRLAVSNALRYFPAETHAELAPEFAEELNTYGHIYMYRYLELTRFVT